MLAFLCTSAHTQQDDPVAYVGHGGFFNSQGHQIYITKSFIDESLRYYEEQLTKIAGSDTVAKIQTLKNEVDNIPASTPQDKLLLRTAFLSSIASALSGTDAKKIRVKLQALSDAMAVIVPDADLRDANKGVLPPVRRFVPDKAVGDFLKRQALLSSPISGFSISASSGQKYLDECSANGVPIPPPIGKIDPDGKIGWKSLGFIPPNLQFIVGTPAEVRVYSAGNPEGMCFALPRYRDDSLQEIILDGAICMGQLSSKVCIWDNQMPMLDESGNTIVRGFPFSTTDMIPIGVPDLAVDPQGRFQAGGAEIEFGTGGTCTSCHAGENPFIVHPKVDLGGGLLMGRLNKPPLNLPTFSTNRYDPLVGASWPQNSVSMAAAKVPGDCSGCHEKDGAAGRLPLLSLELNEYCGILKLAIEKTMPPSAPGSLKDSPDVVQLLKHCDLPPDTANADPTP
ncbi:hypothetical protein X769_15535 [Mesorhizobium sp. LSJC268A00]|nr:hypothetical protein X769_15535 [Mesorhizobium sp. LSJC268A00]